MPPMADSIGDHELPRHQKVVIVFPRPGPLDNPEHWRGRAEHMRVLASDMGEPDTQCMMLKLAEDYGKKLAARAEQRSVSNSPEN